MNIKLDENIPVSLCDELASLGHDVDTVHTEGLTGRSDDDVWSAAQEHQRFFVTQDLDFSDTRRFQPGAHAGVLLVRLKMPGRAALVSRIREVFVREDVASLAGCLAVLSESKLRIRRPA